MGGVAGHMDHLYDDRDLTFSKMKEIILAASRGKITAEESVKLIKATVLDIQEDELLDYVFPFHKQTMKSLNDLKL